MQSLINTDLQNKTIVAYIKGAFCGYQSKSPKVCCPKDTVEPWRLSTKLPPQAACGKIKVSTGKIVGGKEVQLG